MKLSPGAVVSNLSWDENNSSFSVGGGDFTLKNSCNRSNEAIRVWGSIGKGGVLIEGVYAETEGRPGDRADTLQCYDPHTSNNITIRNTTFRAHNMMQPPGCSWPTISTVRSPSKTSCSGADLTGSEFMPMVACQLCHLRMGILLAHSRMHRSCSIRIWEERLIS